MTVKQSIAVIVSMTILFIAFISVVASSGTRTIRNPEVGIWDKSGAKKLAVSQDLSIGEKDGESIFGRITDIAVDSNGNIYILDAGFMRVQKYDANGNYLITFGREGEGPGDFYAPSAIATDVLGRVYVGGRSPRITIYNPDGSPAGDIRREYADCFTRSIVVDLDLNVYVCCADILSQKIIHKYNAEHEYVRSFCDTYAVGKDVDTRVESFYAGGDITLAADGVSIYFTQMVPYEIRHFGQDGELRSVILRKNSFMADVPEPEINGQTITFTIFPGSQNICVLASGVIINVASIPSGDPEIASDTILDLFSADGELLTTKQITGHLSFKCSDGQDRLYAVDFSEYPKVVRYSLIFNE